MTNQTLRPDMVEDKTEEREGSGNEEKRREMVQCIRKFLHVCAAAALDVDEQPVPRPSSASPPDLIDMHRHASASQQVCAADRTIVLQ